MELSGIKPNPLSSIDIMFLIEQELIPIQTILQDCFSRVDTKTHAMSYFQGLISAIERKNSWQLAAQAGCESPCAFQYLSAKEFRESIFGFLNNTLPQISESLRDRINDNFHVIQLSNAF